MMKDLIYHFFPSKALQRQKRYLRRGEYKPHDTKIWYFVCRIYKMVSYLDKFPPFGTVQRLPDNKIQEMVQFSLPEEWNI